MSTPTKLTLLALAVMGSCSCSTLGRGALVAGPAADLVSTQWAKGQGAVEANPLLRSDPALYAGKVGQVGIFLWADTCLKEHPQWRKWFRIIAAGSGFALAAHNVRVGLEAQHAQSKP